MIMKQSVLMGNVLRSANKVPQTIKAMSTKDLADILAGPDSQNVLLIDVRPVVPSSDRRIKDAVSLSVPSTLLKRLSFGLDRIIELMGTDIKQRLGTMEQKKYVVLYDESTIDLKNCGANALYHTIVKMDASGRCGNHLYYLQGGFARFNLDFEKLTEQPPDDSMDVDTSSSSSSSSGGCYLSAHNAASPATPFSLRPVLTSLRASPTWSRVPPGSSVAAVDNTSLRISEVVLDMREQLPNSLRQVVDETLEGRNPIAEKFSKLQNDEQARLTQAYFRDMGNSSGNSSQSSARVLNTPYSNSTKVSPCLSPLASSDDSFEYVLYTGSDQSKNRYSNICPYDHTRVMVGRDGYINASYIRTSVSKLRYIATQAPVPNSFADFWRVVFDHRVPVLVMLTALATQGGHVKSHKYWGVGQYGDVEIVSVEEELFDAEEYLTVRHITLRRGNLTHKLAQMQYTRWTDLGCPARTEDAIMLVRLKHQLLKDYKHTEEGSDWVLVHCSAGCGRTGSFCIIDSVIDFYRYLSPSERRNDSEDHIYDTVQELRRQRLGMVQVQRQFSLCYEAVILWYCKHYLSQEGDGIDACLDPMYLDDSVNEEANTSCEGQCCASPIRITAASR